MVVGIGDADDLVVVPAGGRKKKAKIVDSPHILLNSSTSHEIPIPKAVYLLPLVSTTQS
jgi:hypothetical protein